MLYRVEMMDGENIEVIANNSEEVLSILEDVLNINWQEIKKIY